MKEVLYLDVFFLINFAMDAVSLAVGALASSEKVRLWRILISSFFGAVFSLGLLFFSAKGVWNLLGGLSGFCGMIFVCFGKKSPRRLGKAGLFSFLAALFLGGVVEAISFYTAASPGGARLTLGVFLIASLLAFGAFSLWGKSVDRKLETAVVSLTIRFSGRCEHFVGLVDSGLLLRDPEGSRPVLLMKAAYASPLLPQAFLKRLETGEASGEERLFCVPIKTASGSGELYAFLPESVSVLRRGGRKKAKEHRGVLIALDFSQGGFGGCPCLVPLSVL